jgi:hypothetical protein
MCGIGESVRAAQEAGTSSISKVTTQLVLGNPGRHERHHGMGVDIEEVATAQVPVALGIVGVDRPQFDPRGDIAVELVVRDRRSSLESVETATDLREAEVACREPHLGVGGIDRVLACGQAARLCRCPHACSSGAAAFPRRYVVLRRRTGLRRIDRLPQIPRAALRDEYAGRVPSYPI